MYKLLIVDDEEEIRKGLWHLDWASVGVEPVGECEHGLEACQWLESQPADLILTDIRMPVMNGIELAEQVSKKHAHIKTLVLSGYNDFELARAGMRTGIFDYLLKPVDPAELMAVTARAVEALHTEGRRREDQRRLELKMKRSTNLLRQEFLRKLLFQHVGRDEMEEGCAAAELLLEEKLCAVTVVRLDLSAPWEQAYPDKDRRLIVFAFHNVLDELWDDAGRGYHFINPSDGSVYLISVFDKSADPETRIADIEQIKQHFKRFRGLFRATLSMASGSPQEAQRLHISCKEALQSMAGAPKDSLVVFDSSCSSEGGSPADGLSAASQESRFEQGSESVHYLVEAAKAYIELHFESTLTLQDVAQHVHINASYLSHLFKEATGETFVHHLTSCRLNKAKQLLQGHEYKIYEIGQMVGYENPRYFAEIFKKYTGLTPYEYRNKS